jgi:hypothetical protein
VTSQWRFAGSGVFMIALLLATQSGFGCVLAALEIAKREF